MLDVCNVLFVDDGVVKGLMVGKFVIDMSLILLFDMQVFVKQINVFGCDYFDVLVFGGEVGVCEVMLMIMVGGLEKVFECVKLLFEKMGKNIMFVGDNGVGQICKVVNQIIVVLNIEVVGEVLLFVVCLGVDLECVCQVLMGGFVVLCIFEVYGVCMIKCMFDLGFCIELYQKDLNFVFDGVCKFGFVLLYIVSVQQLFSVCVLYGGKVWDYLVFVCVFEIMLNFEIGQMLVV